MSERPGPDTRPAAIVRGEALKARAEGQIGPDPERLAQGWERRFVVEARRADEFVRLYESLGYEVCADPVRREQVDDGCDDCRIALLLDFRSIYTRRRP
jgi:hypothetical protein